MGSQDSRRRELARTGGQDGQLEQPERMVSQDGRPGWADTTAGEDPRTGGQDRLPEQPERMVSPEGGPRQEGGPRLAARTAGEMD